MKSPTDPSAYDPLTRKVANKAIAWFKHKMKYHWEVELVIQDEPPQEFEDSAPSSVARCNHYLLVHKLYVWVSNKRHSMWHGALGPMDPLVGLIHELVHGLCFANGVAKDDSPRGEFVTDTIAQALTDLFHWEVTNA